MNEQKLGFPLNKRMWFLCVKLNAMKNTTSALVAGLIDAWNSQDNSRILSFYADNYVGEESSDPLPQYGKRGLSGMLQKFFNAFPDLSLAIGDFLIEESRVVIYWTAKGTHDGTIMNIPPTGKPVSIKGVSMLVFQDDQITEGKHFWDLAGFLRDLGLLPKLPVHPAAIQG